MKKKTTKFSYNNLFLVIVFFSFVLIFARASYISLSPIVEKVDLKQLAKRRTTASIKILSSRGTIYDIHGDVLAINVSSYTLIAHLDANRSKNSKSPKHVVDKEMTALALVDALGLDYERTISLLSKTNVKQTEFGSLGRGLTEIQKDKIRALNLPGIDFMETQKRYYPNGDFLSYVLGYAKNNDEGDVIGEMGLEAKYNDYLTGIDGYVKFQKDRNGYKIPNTLEERVEAIQGKDIYLTIDNNLQFFVEQAIKTQREKYYFEEMNIVIADAKTGAILASADYPSFNPNTRNITKYLNPLVGKVYEPGSTMKIYTYMAAMEAGKYKPEATFKSGTYTTRDGTEIGDFNRQGWGTINFDRGFALSSNIGALTLVKDYINAKALKEYYDRLGFGSKTGIEIPGEASGRVQFKYETEIYTAAFGQGISTSIIQNVKALTAISNDGILLEPYIIKKIVDTDTKEELLNNHKKEVERVASVNTVNKMRELMRSVVQEGTGRIYGIPGYDIIAKTGTAEIYSHQIGGYLRGKNVTIRSFAGMYPGDDPQIIIYGTATRPYYADPLANAIKEVIINSSKYLKLDDIDSKKKEEIISYRVESLINKNIDDTITHLKKYKLKPVVLGSGNKIIRQFPEQKVNITNKDKLFLLTNSKEIEMPNIVGWSKQEVTSLANLVGLKLTFNGEGYVKEQSIPKDTLIEKNQKLEVTLSNKFIKAEE